MTRLSRRAYLATAAAALTGLAGCNTSDSTEKTTGSDAGGTSIATPSKTAEPTASPTPTAVAPDATISGNTPALVDEDPNIVFEGLPSGKEVTVTASSPSKTGRTWESSATFQADDAGTVHVPEQAPIDGSYEGVDGAGLVWSMRPVQEVPARQAWFVPPGMEDARMTVSAAVNGTTVAETTFIRRFRTPDMTTSSVEAGDVVGQFVTPDVDDPRPGVVVLHGSGGQPDVLTATMLASHGYPALALKYFGTEDPIPDDLHEVPRSYFDRAADWLRSQPPVRDGDLGLYGTSKGGEGALFLAAYADWVGAVVADVPSAVAFYGLTADWRVIDGASWAVNGDPVSYVPAEGCYPETTQDGLYRMTAAYDCSLSKADKSTIDEATFPIENFEGPILCSSGEEDGMWPSTQLAELAVDRLEHHDAAARIEHRAYENTGHVIPIPYRPTYGLSAGKGLLFGGTPAGIANAAADHWPRVLETFEQGLE